MRSTAMGTPSLLDMPPEILLDVQLRLTYGSRVALRLACHEFHRKIDDPNQRIDIPYNGNGGLVQNTQR